MKDRLINCFLLLFALVILAAGNLVLWIDDRLTKKPPTPK